jgi:hypothetical protein
MIVHSKETNLYCSINGACILPTVKLSDNELDFGVIKLGQKETKILHI